MSLSISHSFQLPLFVSDSWCTYFCVFCAVGTFLSSNFAHYKQRFSENQTLALEQAFSIHPYLSTSSVRHLVKETLLSKKQIYAWFYRKRIKSNVNQEELTLSTGEFI